MVSTRHHPREFPPPEESPSKSSPRKSRTSTASPAPSSPDLNSSPTKSLTKRAVSNSAAAANSVANSFAPPSQDTWSHTASNVTIAWIAISLPLVIWDACYMLLRPHTMEGGALQWPIWKPYEIYAKIDYVYGWPGWNNMDGFGGGQSVMNVIEAVLYGLYIMIVWNHGIWAEGGTGVQIGQGVKGWLSGGVKVPGKTGNKALLIGFSAALMTASKTLLYYLTEYYSGFANTKHNDWITLALFYGVMNGAWLVLPTYMTVTFGTDLFAGLNAATDASSGKKN